jgi:hypothetical protein
MYRVRLSRNESAAAAMPRAKQNPPQLFRAVNRSLEGPTVSDVSQAVWYYIQQPSLSIPFRRWQASPIALMAAAGGGYTDKERRNRAR